MRYVAVETEDGRECHADNAGGNYGTLCGISVDDDERNGREVPLMIGEKINCRTCIEIIRASKQYREKDFVESLRRPTTQTGGRG